MKNLVVYFLARIISIILFILSFTWRVKIEGIDYFNSIEKGIYLFWHRYICSLYPLFAFKNVTILVSLSRDGEWAASSLQFLNAYRVVRGSTSRGGLSAFFSLARILKEDNKVAIPADGPKGPSLIAKRGGFILAKRAGVPVIPVRVYVSKGISFNSWDKIIIPLPFSSVRIVFYQPINVNDPEKCVKIATDKMGK